MKAKKGIKPAAAKAKPAMKCKPLVKMCKGGMAKGGKVKKVKDMDNDGY